MLAFRFVFDKFAGDFYFSPLTSMANDGLSRTRLGVHASDAPSNGCLVLESPRAERPDLERVFRLAQRRDRGLHWPEQVAVEGCHVSFQAGFLLLLVTRVDIQPKG